MEEFLVVNETYPNGRKGRARLLRAALHLLHHHLPVFQILETGVRTPRVSDLFNFSQIFKIIYTHSFSQPNISIEVPPFWANFEIRTSFFTIIKGLWYVTSRFSMSLFGMRYRWASRCCRCLHSVALHLGHLPRWHEQLLYVLPCHQKKTSMKTILIKFAYGFLWYTYINIYT